MMFEVYLGFADPEDPYLGRLLAGLLPNSAGFSLIPPHFICGTENEFVAGAMNSCFRGKINDGGRSGDGISLCSNIKALLLRCLACMVHHVDALCEDVKKYSGHILALIPILSNGVLCGEFRKFQTSEP